MATEGTGKERFAAQARSVSLGVRPIPPPPKLQFPERMIRMFPELTQIQETYNDAWDRYFKEQNIGNL